MDQEKHSERAPWLALDPHGKEPGDPNAGTLPNGEDQAAAELSIRRAAHKAIAGVEADIEAFRFNTAVAKLMEFANALFPYRGSPVAGRRPVHARALAASQPVAVPHAAAAVCPLPHAFAAACP